MNYRNIYAIGDVQGCFTELEQLLQFINFDASQDQLWFVGDLVNRGPQSLATLRFVKNLGHHAITVLGNHDLHLLAVAYNAQTSYADDTLNDILQAPDREELLAWLRHRPLIHYDKVLNTILVHAGIPPQWDLAQALEYAHEVESALQKNPQEFLQNMYGSDPTEWRPTLTGWDRLRYITNAFTRMRFCSESGKLNLKLKESAVSPDPYLMPWFAINERATAAQKIIFGHWAALQGKTNVPSIFAIDTGCIWGNKLTALRLSDGRRFSVKCHA